MVSDIEKAIVFSNVFCHVHFRIAIFFICKKDKNRYLSAYLLFDNCNNSSRFCIVDWYPFIFHYWMTHRNWSVSYFAFMSCLYVMAKQSNRTET